MIYNEHKGWYSFVLGSCYGFLLTFGFIMMTPQVLLPTLTIGMSSSEKLSLEYAVKSFMQLFINYKLKSVAHLPWRMMTYKVDISERGSTNNIFLRL